MQGQNCEYCDKDAIFMCGQCKWVVYCSPQHQLEHWRVHKQQCNIINSYRLRKQQQQVNKQRVELRKKYFNYFMHKIFDSCIKVAEQMVNLQKRHIKSTRQIFNQMQYGISVCLLARSWLNVRNQPKALIVIKSYLEQKMHFLKDMRDIVNFQSLHKKEKKNKSFSQQKMQINIKQKNGLSQSRNNSQILSPKNSITNQNTTINENLTTSHSIIKQFAINKVSLIASVANILNAVKQPVMKMYQIYTEHIQKMFGKQSFQASNCYFMIGSHYMQKGQYYKSIACFIRASELRGNMAGDCYYNLGILFQLLRKPQIALMMFDNAAKLRENQFSENSAQVADVYHNLALINQSLGDFKSAIQNLQKIALIYSKDKNSQQYKQARASIKILEDSFRKHMQKQNQGINPGFIGDLKKGIRKGPKAPDDAISEHSFRDDNQRQMRQKGPGGNSFMKITDKFLNKLNPLQALHISQLQIQLGKCHTIYMAASALGSSQFIRVLKLSKLQELIKQNQILFKHVQIERLSKRGIKQHVLLD